MAKYRDILGNEREVEDKTITISLERYNTLIIKEAIIDNQPQAQILENKITAIRQTRYSDNDCMNAAVQTIVIDELVDMWEKLQKQWSSRSIPSAPPKIRASAILNKIENKFNSLKTGIFSKYIEPHFKAVSLQLFCSGRTKTAVSTVCFV